MRWCGATATSFGEPIDKSGWPWTGESWARCDAAEFHPAADAEHGTQIWSDADRTRVPTAEIQSGPENRHCSPGASNLYVRRVGHSYARDPQGTLDVPVDMAFEAKSTLPENAVDTGYFRDGWRLWLAEDKQVAYVVMPDHVERWPAIVGQAVCA